MPEMVDRIARVIDPEAFLEQPLGSVVSGDVEPLIYIARRESAKMKARLYIFAMREPTRLMEERGETRWRKLVDMLLDLEDPRDGAHESVSDLRRHLQTFMDTRR